MESVEFEDVDYSKSLHELDMWKIMSFIWKMENEGYGRDAQAKILSKKFNISYYYARALLRRMNEGN